VCNFLVANKPEINYVVDDFKIFLNTNSLDAGGTVGKLLISEEVV
jgi:hypothetical protein